MHGRTGPVRGIGFIYCEGRNIGFETEIDCVESSAANFEVRSGTPRSCYFHVDMIPNRMGANCPAPGCGGYTAPVDALSISGVGTHPGGGASGWPGRLAAQRALQP